MGGLDGRYRYSLLRKKLAMKLTSYGYGSDMTIDIDHFRLQTMTYEKQW